jgi:molybdate transport system ATP-binding protein
VDATVTVPAGRTLALLGPNGAGKSTVLEAIAGTVPLDAGRITLADRVLAGDGSVVPARARGIGLLSQDDCLFPTMSVRENVAFGPRSRGASRTQARADAEAWLERVGLAHMGERRPSALSGGQARRVAIARALAAAPRVLLLDEPFAGLDVEAASGVRAVVAELLDGMTAIITTHDALDAHTLAHDVAVMDSGTVVESGDAAGVLARPRTAFGARMAARILVTGTMGNGVLVADAGVSVLVAEGPPEGTRAAIAVRPALVVVAGSDDRDAAGEGKWTWVDQVVTALEPRGDEVRVHGETLAADVDPGRAARLLPGTSVRFGLPHDEAAYAL